jgi:hypothetical protein
MAENIKPPANNAQADIRNALDTIARVILSEDMKSINESIRAVDTKLARAIDDLKQESNAAIASFKNDLSNRSSDLTKSIDAVKKGLDAAVSELGSKIQKAHGELADRISATDSQLKREVTAAKASLEEKLEAYKGQVAKEFKSVNDHIVVHQNELKELRSDAAHTSSILAGFAKIFSAPTNPEAHQILANSAPFIVTPPPPAKPAALSRPSQPKMAPPAAGAGAAKPAARPAEAQEELAMVEAPEEDDIALPNSLDITKTIDSMFNLGKKE